jgi:hypothetical protein
MVGLRLVKLPRHNVGDPLPGASARLTADEPGTADDEHAQGASTGNGETQPRPRP